MELKNFTFHLHHQNHHHHQRAQNVVHTRIFNFKLGRTAHVFFIHHMFCQYFIGQITRLRSRD